MPVHLKMGMGEEEKQFSKNKWVAGKGSGQGGL